MSEALLKITVDGREQHVTLAVAGKLHRELCESAVVTEKDAERRFVRWGCFLLQVWDQIPRGMTWEFLRENGCGNRKTAYRAMQDGADYGDINGELDEAKLEAAIARYNERAAERGDPLLDIKSRSKRTADIIRKDVRAQVGRDTPPTTTLTETTEDAEARAEARAAAKAEEDFWNDGLDVLEGRVARPVATAEAEEKRVGSEELGVRSEEAGEPVGGPAHHSSLITHHSALAEAAALPPAEPETAPVYEQMTLAPLFEAAERAIERLIGLIRSGDRLVAEAIVELDRRTGVMSGG